MKRELYRRKCIRAGCTVDIEETYPTQFGDNLTRQHHIRGPGTPAAMEQYNAEIAIRKLTRIINENFKPDDWYITFHYEKDNRPVDLDQAKAQLSKFLCLLRKMYANAGIELKYIKATAYGERGGIHHHVIINRGIDTRIITALWKELIRASIKARPPEFVALYSTGEYSSLAAYLYGQAEKGLCPEDLKNARHWVCSRNLKKPVEEPPKDIPEIKWKEPPAPWTGYYIDTDNVRAGCNPVTGRPYLFYRMVKLPPGFVCYDDTGQRLTGQTAISYFRANNKNWIKQNWTKLNPEGEIVIKKRE